MLGTLIEPCMQAWPRCMQPLRHSATPTTCQRVHFGNRQSPEPGTSWQSLLAQYVQRTERHQVGTQDVTTLDFTNGQHQDDDRGARIRATAFAGACFRHHPEQAVAVHDHRDDVDQQP